MVCERMAEANFHFDTISSFLRAVGMTFISSVGGAAGPLYGAFFLRAALLLQDDSTINLNGLAAMFRAGLEGIQQRGKAQVGDKTIVDVLQPAVEVLEAAVRDGLMLADALEVAREAAQAGMVRTIDMPAKRGRASYLGARAVGHQDPGATSFYFLIESATRALASPLSTNSTSNGGSSPAAHGPPK
jgi:dihydroxyacetone kinase-like protein